MVVPRMAIYLWHTHMGHTPTRTPAHYLRNGLAMIPGHAYQLQATGDAAVRCRIIVYSLDAIGPYLCSNDTNGPRQRSIEQGI